MALLVSLLLLTARPKFRVLALYTTKVEPDHVAFAQNAIGYYKALATKDGFQFDASTSWEKLNDDTLKDYDVVVWLNDFPQSREQKAAFERFEERGGGWLGHHVAGYNDKYTKWSWYVDFLGGGVFYTNNWPPMPAPLIVDDQHHPVTRGLPAKYQSPANEFYLWKPSPRANKDVKVLVTLDPACYPLGKKDLLTEGDIPVVWTNTKYRMLYINMGHGDKIFDSDIQNRLFENAILWLGTSRREH
jgi:type 1 glutamine amidotransferase